MFNYTILQLSYYVNIKEMDSYFDYIGKDRYNLILKNIIYLFKYF